MSDRQDHICVCPDVREHADAARTQALSEVAQAVEVQYRKAWKADLSDRAAFTRMDTWCQALALVRDMAGLGHLPIYPCNDDRCAEAALPHERGSSGCIFPSPVGSLPDQQKDKQP